MTKEIIEKLAEIEHTRWADWQKYMMLSCFKERGLRDKNMVLEIPKSQWDNWHRQIMTPYKDLTEKEKDSDREQVDRYLPFIQNLLDKQKEEIREKIKNAGMGYWGTKAYNEGYAQAQADILKNLNK